MPEGKEEGIFGQVCAQMCARVLFIEENGKETGKEAER